MNNNKIGKRLEKEGIIQYYNLLKNDCLQIVGTKKNILDFVKKYLEPLEMRKCGTFSYMIANVRYFEKWTRKGSGNRYVMLLERE